MPVHFETACMMYVRADQMAEMVKRDESELAGAVKHYLEDLGPFLSKLAEDAAFAQWEEALETLSAEDMATIGHAWESWRKLQRIDPRLGITELVWSTRPRPDDEPGAVVQLEERDG